MFKLSEIIQKARLFPKKPCWNQRHNEAILWFCRGSWNGVMSKGFTPGKTAGKPQCPRPSQPSRPTAESPESTHLSGLGPALLDRHEAAICAWGPSAPGCPDCHWLSTGQEEASSHWLDLRLQNWRKEGSGSLERERGDSQSFNPSDNA